MGRRAFGVSSGLAVKVGNDDPGPHRIIAWKDMIGFYQLQAFRDWGESIDEF